MLSRSKSWHGSEKCIAGTADRREWTETCRLQPAAPTALIRESTKQSFLQREAKTSWAMRLFDKRPNWFSIARVINGSWHSNWMDCHGSQSHLKVSTFFSSFGSPEPLASWIFSSSPKIYLFLAGDVSRKAVESIKKALLAVLHHSALP